MEELCFESSLTPEEIAENFKGADLFSALMEGLQEAFDYERGNPHPGTRVRTWEDEDLVEDYTV